VGGRWWGGTGYPLYRPFEPQSSGLRQQNSVDAVGGRWWVGTGYPLTQKPTLSTGPLKLNLQSLRPQTAKLSQLALFVQLAHWSVVNVWIFDELRLACSRHCSDTVYVKQLTCFTVCSENCCTCGIVSYQDVNRVFLCRIVHCDLFPIYIHTRCICDSPSHHQREMPFSLKISSCIMKFLHSTEIPWNFQPSHPSRSKKLEWA